MTMLRSLCMMCLQLLNPFTTIYWIIRRSAYAKYINLHKDINKIIWLTDWPIVSKFLQHVECTIIYIYCEFDEYRIKIGRFIPPRSFWDYRGNHTAISKCSQQGSTLDFLSKINTPPIIHRYYDHVKVLMYDVSTIFKSVYNNILNYTAIRVRKIY